MEHLISHFYRISSQDRSSGQTIQSFTVQNPNLDDSHSFRVEEVIIPVTWYGINSTNNILNFSPNSTGFVTITIPPGNYNVTTFISALQTAMNAAGGGQTYTATISTTTGLLTITANAGNFIIDNTSAIQYIMGLSGLGTTTSTASVFIAPNVINLTGTNAVNISSRELTKYSTKSLTSDTGSSSDHLCTVPVTLGFGSTIFYKPYNKYFTYNGTKGAQVDLQIYDQWHKPLNLNGND